MTNDRLYIDGVLVDLGDNVDITLVVNSNLFRDLTQLTGNTSYTIRLPRTANNAAVFGMAGDVRSDTTFPTQYHTADYIRNGVPIITGGRAVLLSVTDYYEISITWGAFAPLADIVNKGTTLNQLGGTDTIAFGNNNKVTGYAQAMADGYYYASYDGMRKDTSTQWTGCDAPNYNNGSQSYALTLGVVLTGAVGTTISLQPTARAGTQYVIAPFAFGMVAYIGNVTGAADARAWCIVDEANTVVLVCDDLTTLSDNIMAPVTAAKLIVNTTTVGTVTIGYRSASAIGVPRFTQYSDGYARLPVVNVSWILDRIKADTGVDFVFPLATKQYIGTLAVPLVTAKANGLTMGGVTVMTMTLQYALGSVGVNAVANTIFSEQSGTVFQLTATRGARLVVDVQSIYEWTFAGATPQGTGTATYDGVQVTTRNYHFAATYIEIKVDHTDPDADDSIYIVGNVDAETVNVMQTDYQTDNGSTFMRLIAGYGEIELTQGDVVTFTLKNRIGTLNGFMFYGGRIIINEGIDGDVPRGASYPIAYNLPEIKITDFVQFLCAITGSVPLNVQKAGAVEFVGVNSLFTSAAVDWTAKVIPSDTATERAIETTYRINDYGRKNWYRWKEDETVTGNYDGCMEINDETLEAEHVIMEFPFAASDGNRVPLFTRGSGSVFGNNGADVAYEPITLKGCEPRIMSVYQTTSGLAALRFDIDMQDVIDTKMEGIAASLADVRVIKERVRLTDVELAAFNESRQVYLRQYGSHFAVLSLESNGDGTALATMLRLRKSVSQPVPQPYDYEVDYLESSGTQFINTGIKASNNVQIRTYLADFFDEQNKNKGAFGGRSGGGSSEFGIMMDNSGNISFGNGSQIALSPYTNYSPRCHVEFGGGTWKIGAATGTYTPDTYESIYTIYLFAMNNSGGAVGAKCKMGATYITDGVTTLDLIPVVKNGVGYMYDRISGQLFGNDGSGAFTWGNLPYDADVEYLQSGGTQYINTGYLPTDATVLFAKYYCNVKEKSPVFVRWTGASTYDTYGVYIKSITSTIVYCGRYSANKYVTINVSASNDIYLDIGLTGISINGTSVALTRGTFTSTYPLWLFIGNNMDASFGASSAKIYVCRASENGVKQMDLIPVRKNGVGYMYDRVTDTLFGNDGTGDFVIGQDV